MILYNRLRRDVKDITFEEVLRYQKEIFKEENSTISMITSK